MAELCGKPAKAGVRHFPVMSRFPVMYGMDGRCTTGITRTRLLS